MKYWMIILLFSTLVSCVNNKVSKKRQKEFEKELRAALKAHKGEAENKAGKEDICWEGNLGDKVPVFIHYQTEGNVLIGEISYLDTQTKEPIKLAGEMDENMNFKLLEFDKTGNITGVLTGDINEGKMTGTWFSPKSRRELKMELTSSDSIIQSVNIKAAENKLSGKYHYQYSKAGYSGSFNVSNIKDDKYVFDVCSVTEDPARNVASVEKDTVEIIANYFNYLVPDSEDCKFKVRFFKDFIFIDYMDGYCTGQFGYNATVEGVYLKVK